MIKLREKALVFFTLNPDEELSIKDAVAKWGYNQIVTRDVFSRLAANGLVLAVSQRPFSATIYSAGPELKKLIG